LFLATLHTVTILRDHSHYSVDNGDVCAHCGQPLHAPAPHYGERGANNRTGLIVTVLLHLLLIAIYLIQPKHLFKPPSSAGQPEITWVAPLQGKAKPKPAEQAPKKTVKPAKKSAPERIQVQRLPNTITIPDEKPVEQPKVEPKKEEPQADSMQAFIEARRKARGAAPPSDTPAGQDDNARAMNNALRNIASVNARSNDPNDTGGVFSVTNQTFSSATLKFRGWNPNFKRRWLTQVTVELGGERDIETAIVKKMIELIRKEKTGDFEWDSHRLNRVVTLSARPQDTEALQAFLYKEMFENYKPPK
jgi:hypothetical protein